MSKAVHRGALLLIAALVAAVPALAQSPAEFYRGKIVTMIVSSASGGGYDTLSRVLAAHLGRHIPGNPCATWRARAG
jgi:tripartite-type tricarboxylate transporter receptor subunit TctC